MLSIVDVKTDIRSEKIIATTTLKNTGNVSLDTDIAVKIRGLLGNKVGERNGTFVVLARQTADVNFEFDRPLIGGFYKVDTTASYSDDTSKELGEVSEKNQAVRDSRIIFISPAPSVLAALMIIMIAFAYGIWRMRMIKKPVTPAKKKKAAGHAAKKPPTKK